MFVWSTLALVAWDAAFPLRAVQPAGAAEKPNVLVIFTDDQGYADLSCQGIRRDVRTPHIDALAAGGVRMTCGYVTAPQCVPSRAGLLTGRYQNRFGVEHNKSPLDGFNAELTIAERLKKAGYVTGMTGKWHLGPAREIVQHGFDFVYFKHSNGPAWANFDLDGHDRKPGPMNDGLYHIDANTAAACAFIRRHHDQPFFFYCAYRAPHVPLDPPQKYLKRFPGRMPERRRKALAMISAVDEGVGQILLTLRRYGLEQRTLVFFISDNGAPLKIHKLDAPGGGPGWDGSLNDLLNGEKGMLTEGG
ncbi:MAG TPA: sulfatase, partial [Planctomycetaceae bacterium]|nr:sulfatase [Planctomycetaceae bacterium]